jgi:hypothetical protein
MNVSVPRIALDLWSSKACRGVTSGVFGYPSICVQSGISRFRLSGDAGIITATAVQVLCFGTVTIHWRFSPFIQERHSNLAHRPSLENLSVCPGTI